MPNGEFKVFDYSNPSDFEAWLNLWNQWDKREVFVHPFYLNLFSDASSHPFCAAYVSKAGFVLYPFLLRTLDKEEYFDDTLPNASDIISPYGYGGAFSWPQQNKEDLANRFWLLFDQWAQSKNIISEVIKFSLFSEDLLPYPGKKEETLKNIVVDLSQTEEQLWMGFEHKVRKNVNRAKSNNLTVIIDTEGKELEQFMTIYNSTMDRRNASQNYFYSPSFFNRICQDLCGQFAFFHVITPSQEIISTELILISKTSVFSFLGGTRSEFFHLRPNDLLKYEVILWARREKKNNFVLGGGYTSDDGIFNYKRSFAPKGIYPFYVGSRVMNTSYYNRLIENKKRILKEKGLEWVPRLGFIPEYRT
jgi:hypothetical protein